MEAKEVAFAGQRNVGWVEGETAGWILIPHNLCSVMAAEASTPLT